MKKLNKKGQVMQNLGALGIGVVTVAFVLVITFLIMASVKTQTVTMGYPCGDLDNVWNVSTEQCCNVSVAGQCGGDNVSKATSNSWNSTRTLTNATATIPSWIPLIILVAIGGLILGLISVFKR